MERHMGNLGYTLLKLAWVLARAEDLELVFSRDDQCGLRFKVKVLLEIA